MLSQHEHNDLCSCGSLECVLAAIPHSAAALSVARAEKVIPFIIVQTTTGFNANAAQHTGRCSRSSPCLHNKASCIDAAVFELLGPVVTGLLREHTPPRLRGSFVKVFWD